jgi:activating signal cointegrator complex subunit 2
MKAAETILELAYIENPKLFDRDANTRRSKARADLRLRTGEKTFWP